MKRITMSLSPDLAYRVVREARLRHTSVSAVIRDALDEHFGTAPEGKRKLPFAALGESKEGDVGIRAEEYLKDLGFGEDSLGR
ncbi:MAG: hypothetical protein QOJ38_1182 [Solirubrobacterales bacterium]|nr:hypothetical protein [Solirubrobacterales bacterium]